MISRGNGFTVGNDSCDHRMRAQEFVLNCDALTIQVRTQFDTRTHHVADERREDRVVVHDDCAAAAEALEDGDAVAASAGSHVSR